MSTGAIVAALSHGTYRKSASGPLAPHHVNEEEREVAALQNALRAKELFYKYDMDRSNQLDRDEVRQMLTDLDWSSPPGTAPFQEEIDFVFKVADIGNKQHIARSEVLYAVMAWELYIKGKAWKKHTEQAINEFQIFDRDQNSRLDCEELRRYLTKVNKYNPVSREEAEWVLHVADRLGDNAISNHKELLMATAAWKVHVERRAARSKVCSIM